MTSHVLLVASAILGAIGHAYLTQRQEMKSPRTVFDIVTAGMFGALYPVLPMERIFDLAGVGFLALPGITDWPYMSQAAYMLGVGYVFSSVFPNLIDKVNSLLKAGTGLEIKLPSTRVVVLPTTRPLGQVVERALETTPRNADPIYEVAAAEYAASNLINRLSADFSRDPPPPKP